MRRSGFSVLEVLLSLTTMVFILSVIVVFLIRGYDVFLGVDSGAQSVRVARRTLSVMVNNLREAQDSPSGVPAITAADDTSITFFADVDDDGIVEQVRFSRSGNDLLKGVSELGAAPDYLPGVESSEIIGSNIVNTATPIFTFYDSSYDGEGDPLPSPVNPNLIRFIDLQVEIDHNLTDESAALTARSAVQLRNLPFPF